MISIPTPAGAPVGLAKFAIIAAGAGAGAMFAFKNGVQWLPADWVSMGNDYMSPPTWLVGAGALIGGALAGMVASKL